jgi:membrane fusion protein (multidrug efflux system)
MKKIFTILIATLFLVSCGGDKKENLETILNSGNLEKIQTKKKELEEEQVELISQIEQLNEQIEVLDTVKKLSLITTFIAKEEIFNHYLELQGNVTTKENLVIYPEYSGVLTSVYVKEGQRVSKGQRLAKIDDGGMSQQLAQLEIQANLAKTTFERQERLWNQKIGSEIQFLQAKSNYEAQQEAVNQMKSQLAKTAVIAPFSGTIENIFTNQGSVVAPGVQLFRIVNLSNMYIETDVPEKHLNNVIKNKDVIIDFPILNKTINSKIRQASNFINPANRTFKIEVAVPNKDHNIKPNLTVKLKINDYTNPTAILIPQSIISENANGEQYVYIAKDRKGKKATTQRVIIKTGKTQGDVIEVLEGIENGVEIIQEGARTVKNGQTVEVITL